MREHVRSIVDSMKLFARIWNEDGSRGEYSSLEALGMLRSIEITN